MLLDQLRLLILTPDLYEKCQNAICNDDDLQSCVYRLKSSKIGVETVEDLVKLLKLKSKMGNEGDLDSKTPVLKQCVTKAESVSETEIPKWFEKHCNYKGNDYDERIQADRLRRRWNISESVQQPELAKKCNEALNELTDDDKNRKMREAKMKAADKKKDTLIAKYSKKPILTQYDKDYLLSEGVVVKDLADGKFQFVKTQDKLLDLKWHNINPANVDANEFGMEYIKNCRYEPKKYLA